MHFVLSEYVLVGSGAVRRVLVYLCDITASAATAITDIIDKASGLHFTHR